MRLLSQSHKVLVLITNLVQLEGVLCLAVVVGKRSNQEVEIRSRARVPVRVEIGSGETGTGPVTVLDPGTAKWKWKWSDDLSQSQSQSQSEGDNGKKKKWKTKELELGKEVEAESDGDKGSKGDKPHQLSLTVNLPAALIQYEKPLKVQSGGKFSLITPVDNYAYQSQANVNLRCVTVQYLMQSIFNPLQMCFLLFFLTTKHFSPQPQQPQSQSFHNFQAGKNSDSEPKHQQEQPQPLWSTMWKGNADGKEMRTGVSDQQQHKDQHQDQNHDQDLEIKVEIKRGDQPQQQPKQQREGKGFYPNEVHKTGNLGNGYSYVNQDVGSYNHKAFLDKIKLKTNAKAKAKAKAKGKGKGEKMQEKMVTLLETESETETVEETIRKYPNPSARNFVVINSLKSRVKHYPTSVNILEKN